MPGPNGSGKTTLLQVLARPAAPDVGEVRVTPAEATVGYLPQEAPFLVGETVAEFLARRTGVAAGRRDPHPARARWHVSEGSD